ncbi:uncharacterized protein G2W53_042470 [Senna tora]|uniref:Uncharacterized protein n=1 Tax=Senna tora TaxID=362788 RepID=A0A834W3Y3_9FABA|nr:uncharacterized protein G2W53_042470 [Senna tora]
MVVGQNGLLDPIPMEMGFKPFLRREFWIQ